MHLFIEFIYKIISGCNKSCAECDALQSWFFEKRAPSLEDCTSLSQDTIKVTDQTFSFFCTPICSCLFCLPIWGCEEERVQDRKRRGNCGCPKAGTLKKQQKATFSPPDLFSIWSTPVVGQRNWSSGSALRCWGLREVLPRHICKKREIWCFRRTNATIFSLI